MPSEQYLQVRKIAEEKRHHIRILLKDDPTLTNEDINGILKETYGSVIDGNSLALARRELGISKRKSKKSNGKITEEDVIILQKPADIPADILEVLGEVKAYMRDIGITRLELEDDGKVKLTLLRELETMV